jgi:hypothetical protein
MQDPNFVIVLREMSQRETEVLFEHTRRLRSHHGDRLFIEADEWAATFKDTSWGVLDRKRTAAEEYRNLDR